jgi:ubiquinone/menaquinone biosynthesis C-methylase UbiE
MANWYDRHLLPYVLDFACGMKPIRKQRRKVVPLAWGKVLEIGIGTGLNLAYYNKALVKELTGLDPALEMHRLAEKRADKAGLSVNLVGLSAEKIPRDDATFDTVLMTYTLCSIPDPVAALAEMRRVLKPGGRLLFCEHGLAPDASVRAWQERLNPTWGKIAGGCHLNRNIPLLLERGGFRPIELEERYLPGPRPLTYNYWGTAESAR